MADFTAVLRKTIEGLGENTPEVRQKVYAKARTAIAAKLAAVNPPLPPAAIGKQREALEEAVRAVEAEYTASAAGFEFGDDLESAIASLEAATRKPLPGEPRPFNPPPSRQPLPPLSRTPLPPLSRPAGQPDPRNPASPGRPSLATPTLSQPAFPPRTETKPASQVQPFLSRPPQPAAFPPKPAMPRAEPMAGHGNADQWPDEDDDFGAEQYRLDSQSESLDDEPREPRRYGGLVAAFIALVILVGAGYAAYAYRDDLKGGVASLLPAKSTAPAEDKVADAPVTTPEPAAQPAPEAGTAPAAGTDVASAEPDPAASATPAEAPKFTQRLNSDGSETDSGPAAGEPKVGEGTAVASVTTPGPKVAAAEPVPAPASPAPDAAAETPPVATPETAAADPAQPAPATGEASTAPATSDTAPATPQAPAAEPTLAVAQKAIFYEERTSSQPQSAENGTIVWSLVQESPGNDLPPEPAIRAEANIPGRDLKLRMTIRRNADKTLPASHIIEMIFLTPPNFAGGSIDNVLRITMKDTEQTAGSPLAGIPARIADGYFLMALSDGKAESDANIALLRGQKWIDIPIVYKSGRRALITMEKGLPGERVFDEALKAWGASSSG